MIDINKIKEGNLHSIYPSLYGSNFDENKLDTRFINLLKTHKELFNKDSADLFSTAGRSELGGNHTDHNLGKVIAATINLDTIAAVNKTDDNVAVIISEGFDPVKVDLTSLDYVKSEENTTDSLVRGIAAAFKNRGLNFGGFIANTTTSVLKGSGLSSSAAIEVLCATIFNHLYNSDILDPVELAKISQFAENTYYGKPSGLMDQCGCACGGIISIDFKNNSNPQIKKIPFSFAEHGYDLLIIDTKGSHDDLTHCYSAIPYEMKEVAHYFNKEVLREVDFNDFLNNIENLRKTLKNDRAILRTFHYFNENKRVDKMVNALENDKIENYFSLVNASGQSSFNYLQNVYNDENPKEQGLSLALALLESFLDDIGAKRVHGGGFAGTVQAYVKHEKSEQIINKVELLFNKGCVTKLNIRDKATTCFA